MQTSMEHLFGKQELGEFNGWHPVRESLNGNGTEATRFPFPLPARL